MRLFNPFDFFFAQDGELNNAVTYLRDCVNAHDTTEFPAAVRDWEPCRPPRVADSQRDVNAVRTALGRLRRRINRH